MKSDYQIEDLTFQNSDTVTYRARKHNGRPHTLTRLNLPEKQLTPLREGKFQEAYTQLLRLKHGCLRAVADGGLDPVDEIPWIATRWYEGTLLSDQIEDKTLTGADIARIRFHGEALIHDMGNIAGALSFDPSTIVTTRSLEGEKVSTFEFSYVRWFSDWAQDITPGGDDDAYKKLNQLIAKLEDAIEEVEKIPVPTRKMPRPLSDPDATNGSLYLALHPDESGNPSNIEETLLRQFEGKEILVKGEVTTLENSDGNKGKRLVIRLQGKESIEPAS